MMMDKMFTNKLSKQENTVDQWQDSHQVLRLVHKLYALSIRVVVMLQIPKINVKEYKYAKTIYKLHILTLMTMLK